MMPEICELYVEFGLDSSHTHEDGPLHVHVLDFCQHGGVTLQVPAVEPVADAATEGKGRSGRPSRHEPSRRLLCFARKN